MAESLTIKINGDADDFKGAINASQKEAKALEDSLSSFTKKSAIAFAAFAGIIGVTVSRFATFDNELRGVKTLLNESSFGAKGLEKGFQDLTKGALDLAKKIPVSIGSLNKALFDTISAGVDASQAIGVLEQAGRLATAGLTDVATATDGLTSALGAYSLKADQAESVSAKFFTAQKQGKTTIAELSSGFGLVGASAAAFGVSLNELLGAVSATTVSGIKTNQAYTGLKATISNIAKPTADAAAEAKRLGVEFNAAALRSKGLVGFLDGITSSSKFTADTFTKLFGSVEAVNVVLALTGKNAKRFKDNVSELSDEQRNATTLTNAYATQSASLKNQFALLVNKADALSISIGEKLSPSIAFVVEKTNKLIDVFSQNESLVKFSAIAIATGAALTGLATAAGALAAILAGPLGTAIAGLAAGIGLVVSAFALAEKSADEINNINYSKTEDKLKALKDRLVEMKVEGESAGKSLNKTRDEEIAKLRQYISETERQIQVESKLTETKKSNEEKITKKKQEELEKQDITEQDYANLKKIRAIQWAIEQEEIETEENFRKVEANQELIDALGLQEELKTGKFSAESKKRLALFGKEVKSQKDMRNDTAREIIAAQNRERAQYEKDVKASNESIAKANSFFRTQELANTKDVLSSLATLTQSSNKQLFAIGKAAAIASAIVNTAQGATKALAQGGIAGPVLAASVVAAGAVQLSNIYAQKFAKGGLVQGGIPGVDSVPIVAQRGEVITPRKNFDEVVGSVRAKREADKLTEGSGLGIREIIIGFKDSAFEIIEEKILERRAINAGVL